MPEMHLPWLEFSILIPLIGAILCGLQRDTVVARRQAMTFSFLTALSAIGEWLDFTTLHTFLAHDHWDLLRLLAHRDVFVIDELSAPLLPLTSLLYFLTILSTQRTKVGRFSFGLTLLSESIALATFSCREPWLIITFLSLAVIPPWIELKRRQRCTRVYVLHMGLYVVFLLVGWTLVQRAPVGTEAPLAGSAMLTLAALLRAGVVPLHPWLTDLFDKASFGTALLFVAPVSGAYAVMRLVLPVAPSWAMQGIAILSLITAVYAAGMALVQTDSRRFFCFLFLSHSSLVLAGLEIVTPIGMTGALCVWLSVGLSLGGLGLTLRSIEARIGRVHLDQFHGLYENMHFLASLFLLMGLSSIGFPGTLGFVGMEMLVEGTVEVYPLAGTAIVLAAALNGIAILKAYFRIFTGTRHVTTVVLRAKPSERAAVLVLTLLVLGGGLWPQPGVHSRYHAASVLLRLRSASQSPTSNDPHHDDHEPTALDRLLQLPNAINEVPDTHSIPEHDAESSSSRDDMNKETPDERD